MANPDFQRKFDSSLAYSESNTFFCMDSAKLTGGEDPDHELAAWTLVARAVMNLDEAITKP